MFIADHRARFSDGAAVHGDAVGPHIGDQTHRLAADRHAFIEPLGGAHGALGVKAKLARGLLLQRGGGEGRGRVALGGFGFHRRHGEVRAVDGGFRRFRGGFIADGQARDLLAVILVKLGGDQPVRAVHFHVGVDRPVFLGNEFLDLAFALGDQAQGDRLHPAGRARAGQFAPQHRRQGEAHQIIERAAGEISLHQLHIDLARARERFGDGLLGDGVERDALHRLAFESPALGQRFQQVPGNGFAFPVRVSREDQAIGVLKRIRNRFDSRLRLGVDGPLHGEIFVWPHRAVLGRQIAHMSKAGQDRVIGAEIFVDGFGFGRGFDDDDVHKRGASNKGSPYRRGVSGAATAEIGVGCRQCQLRCN
jgi:hypothetical protein